MARAGKPPRSVELCVWMVRAAAHLTPAAQRAHWRSERLGDVARQWEFLHHAGLWSRRESLALVRHCLRAFPDAVWQFARQESVQRHVRAWTRSPWTCLGSLAALLVLLGALTNGFPATRQLIFQNAHGYNNGVLYVLWHPTVGGEDKEFPSDVAPAWNSHSKLLESAAGFHVSEKQVTTNGRSQIHPLVIETERALFKVLHAKPALGSIPANAGVVIDQQTWRTLFHSDQAVVGSIVRIGKDRYPITAVLPTDFYFLTRRPTAFLVTKYLSGYVNVVARARTEVSAAQIDSELPRIAEDVTYSFFYSQLRLSFVKDALWTPVEFFGIAVGAIAFLCLWVTHIRLRRIRAAFRVGNRNAAARRGLFFTGKLALALALAFTAGLEWARGESAFMFASRDPGAGPFLLWLYIIATMGVFFWAIADQRARCRACLRLLCFPVRIGCPGCLLLNWSGTELLCSEGHGVLHVPHMAASWDEEAERWISLDDSWKSLFVETE